MRFYIWIIFNCQLQQAIRSRRLDIWLAHRSITNFQSCLIFPFDRNNFIISAGCGVSEKTPSKHQLGSMSQVWRISSSAINRKTFVGICDRKCRLQFPYWEFYGIGSCCVIFKRIFFRIILPVERCKHKMKY